MTAQNKSNKGKSRHRFENLNHQIVFSLVLGSIVLCVLDCSQSSQQTEHLRKQFQSKLDRITSEYGFPGMTAAYIRSDDKVQAFASGLADVEQGIAMSIHSRMLAASIGKTFTGAMALALTQEGKLDLDLPIKHYLKDEKWFSRLPNHDTITLRHLLTHSSGIEDHVHTEAFARALKKQFRENKQVLQPRELVAFVLDTPARFKAGSAFHYSDTGYILVGLIIEKVTGGDLDTQIKQRFLTPLGLNMTAASNQKNLPGLAPGYLSAPNIFGLPPKTTLSPGLMAWNPGIEGAGGGFVSNSRDLAVWGQALYAGRALPGNYLPQVLQAVDAGPAVKYGIATVIREDQEGHAIYGHQGWIPGYCSSLQYYTGHELVVAFQINTDIGIIGSNQNVMQKIEKRLVRVLTNSKVD